MNNQRFRTVRRDQRQSLRRSAFWRPALERLEERSVLALLGVSIGLPVVNTDSTGTLAYNATTDAFVLNATPSTFTQPPVRLFSPAPLPSLQIRTQLSESGALIGGVMGDDLILTGTILGTSYVGNTPATPLLTGEIVAFGYLDTSDADLYDFRFTPTGGVLLPLFAGKDIGVTVSSEGSNFTGNFALDFGGRAKAVLGPIDLLIPTPPVIDGRISILSSATNEVTQPHSFTTFVEVNDNLPAGATGGDSVTGFRPATDDEVQSIVVTLENANGADASILSPLDPESDEMVSSGTNNFVVNFNSASAGVVVGSALATITIGTQTIQVETNGSNGSSNPALKTYVDGKITITPTATNEVGQSHTFTVTVLENAGNGIGFVPAPDEVVTVSFVNLNGATASILPFSGTTNAAGQLLVTVNSATVGQVIANATGTIIVGGLTLTRDTDPATGTIGAGPGGSGPATKTYVDARVSITPSATNEVGQPHTFTVTVLEDAGDGLGLVAASGEAVTVNLTNLNGAGASPTTFTGTTNGSGQFVVTTNSSTAGQIVANAAGTIVVGGLTLTRDTDPATATLAGPGGSGPATKTYVDARIVLTPLTATNPINDQHVITATVQQDDGLTAAQGGDGVTGFTAAPNGTVVAFALTNNFGATAGFVGGNTAVVSGGVASVTINSVTAGTVTINGTTNFIVGGQSLTRDTDPATSSIGAGPDGSGPATKIYVTPGIDIEKTTNGPSNSNPTAPDYDNEDADNGPGVPVLTPGTAVTWTYKVTNTGGLPFLANQVVVTDDNGTPSNAADDLSTTAGQITFLSVQTGDLDNILEPGEVWIYQATGTVLTLPGSSAGSPVTFDFSGNSALDGTDGNIRTFTAGGVSVKASAFSRDKSNGDWATAWLGSYGGGLGVTDSSEGTGSNNTHTVDNMGGRDNYVLLEFDQDVIVDAAFLGYVVGDSDIKVWIGTRTNPFTNHVTLSDSVLSSLGFTEVNLTDLSSTRTADVNAGNIVGNVVVFAADPGDTTPEDQFKIETLKVKPATHNCYENKAVVTVPSIPGLTDSDLSHYCNPTLTPGIDIEKTTNGTTNSNTIAPDYDNEDAANGAGVPILTAGSTVTWTYQVTNTGNTVFTSSQVLVTDDNGTPSNTADDLSTTGGQITFLSYQTGDTDSVLEPGEVWIYKATGVVQTLNGSTPGAATTFDFSGSSNVNGTPGNVRTFTQGAISVKGSAFSRDKSTGAWATAFLGSYGGGLGVTDGIEDGSSDTHTVDNVGRDNYVLLRFSESVIVDSAFLGYVVNDSDLRVWIGTISNAYNTTVTLSDATLASLGFTEVNLTDLATSRTADLNAGNVQGNVLVIAADPGDNTPEDRFKIELLTTKQPTGGVYANKGTVTVPGDSDSDLSHYKNPAPPPASINIEKYVREVGIGGGEGLTPGYWKQTQHFGSWVGYTQGQSFNAVFGVNDPDNPTLLQALQTGGGGFDALGRHAVAALLNASNPNVSYAYSVSQVIAKVQYAYANTSQVEATKNLFAAENEKGADLSSGGGTSVDGPNIDADTTPGLIVQTGNQVAFTYYVTNPGTVALTNVVVIDDNQTPSNTSDDFPVAPVLSSGYNIGDVDRDSQLDLSETWQFAYGPILVTEGQHTNIGRVTGTPVGGGSTVTDNDPANWFGISDKDGSISGKKWLDVTGNGLSSDDLPLAGTVIYLDLDNDGVKDSGEFSTTTAANGTYTFSGLAVGTYTIREVLSSNMVRTGPTLSDNYVVTLSTGETETGKDFANFEKCLDCDLTNVFYTITRNGSSFNVTTLNGNTNQGDEVTVTFTIPSGSGVEQFSLVSYTAPDAYFSAERASQQQIFEGQTGYFMTGTHTMNVSLPGSNYQVDFVCGPIINQLGPAGSNIFYTPQGRLISADNDGYNTGSANFQGVTLVLGGSAAVDDLQFKVASDPSKISVAINNAEAGQVSLGAGSGVTITRLAANGYGGNDTIKVSTSFTLPAVLRGGSGNDTVIGGAGNDIILGEAGCDTITGNAGRDLLIGGADADFIRGNVDDDILIGGTTGYDADTHSNRIALDAIMSEWVRTDRTFAQRVYNISNGTSCTTADTTSFSTRKNGGNFLVVKNAGQNVFDDNVKDTLYGDENNDWLLTNNDEGTQNDSYYTGERITDID